MKILQRKLCNIHLCLRKTIQNLDGLYFKLEDINYYELSDLMAKINGIIESNESKKINIEWCWDYQGNDDKDTIEGSLALSYSFDISLISVNL